jgi:hypothetical protein
MQVINITSLSGTAPYDIYVCDETITYCFLVASATDVVPQQIDLPSFLSGANSIIIKVIDSIGCEEFRYIPCLPPTPTITPTITITPSITVTQTKRIFPCFCIEYDNSGSGEDIGYQYYDCNGILIVDKALDGDVFRVCGFDPSSDSIKLSYFIVGDCSTGSCGRGPAGITPTPTPTNKLTRASLLLSSEYYGGSVLSSYTISSDKPIDDGLTMFFTNELPMEDGTSIIVDTDVTIFPGKTTGFTEVTLEDNFNLLTRDSIIRDVTYKNSNRVLSLSYSATSFFATPTNTVTSSITPSITPTNTVTPSITPSNTVTNTPTNTPTLSPTKTMSPTPTITPTNSVTPSITPTISITPSITKTPTVTRTQTPTRTITP